MIFLVLTSVPRGLRGDLSRWLLEVSPGVFTGRVSRRVRDRLWTRVERGVKDGCAVLVVANHDREQGFEVLTAGRGRWVPVDFGGLVLMRRSGTVRPGPEPGPRRSGGPAGPVPDLSGVFHVVLAEDWPDGALCSGCGRTISPGEPFAQRPTGLVCLACGIPELPGG